MVPGNVTAEVFFPAGVTAGDILLLHASHNNSGIQAALAYTIAPEFSFEQVIATTSTIGAHRSWIYLREADGTETTTTSITIATTAGSSGVTHGGVIHRFSNATTAFESTSVFSGTTRTVFDAAVTTLGSSRLAVNCVVIGFNTCSTNFDGETGGDWAQVWTSVSSGPALQFSLHTADMPSSDTIDGGSFGFSASGLWIASGLALISATAAAPAGTFLIFDSRIFVSPLFGMPT